MTPIASEDLPWVCDECKTKFVVRVLARDCENAHALERGDPLPNPDVVFGHAPSPEKDQPSSHR